MSEQPRSAVSDGAELVETYSERLVGLTEMLPAWTTEWAEKATERSAKGAKIVYRCVCLLTWVCFSASMMLLAPVVFETERDMLERRRVDQERNKIRNDVLREME